MLLLKGKEILQVRFPEIVSQNGIEYEMNDNGTFQQNSRNLSPTKFKMCRNVCQTQ